MSNTNTQNFNNSDYELDLKELFNVLWDGKWLIILITSIFSVAVVLYSLSLPNIYQSKALLSSVSGKNSLSSSIRAYSGLAGLAGINLPSMTSNDNKGKALDKINSLSFFQNNILPNIYLPDLMALKSWSRTDNRLIYDDEIFNVNEEKWVREFKYPQTQVPSVQESYRVFRLNHLSVSEDKKTGFVTIAVKHKSPFIAKEWTDLIVTELNNFYKVKDKAESQAAVDYLNVQMSKTSFAEIKEVIAQLLQDKIQQLTLLEVSDFYVFEYIDPPAVMERKASPSRAVICIIGALLGGFLSLLIVIAKHYFFSRKIK